MALLFNGTTQYCRKTSPVSFPSDWPVTMAGFALPKSVHTGCIIGFSEAAASDNSDYLMILSLDDASSLRFRVQRSDNTIAAQSIQSTSTYSTNTLYHVVGVFRSTTSMELYIDGVSASGSSVSAQNIAANTDSLTIGTLFQAGGPTLLFDGELSECAMWDAELSIDEIKALANGVSPARIRRKNLKVHAPLWTTNSPTPDLSGSGDHLTLTASPTLASHGPVGRYNPQPLTSFRHVRDTREAVILDRLTPA